MGITISQQTHSTKPKDIFEPPFATLHYFVSEHIAGEKISYRSIAVSTDETKDFTEITALKEHFKKEARNFALSQQIVHLNDSDIDADSGSISTMSAMVVRALFEFAEQAKAANKKLESAFDSAFSKKVAFKCADNIVREISIAEIAAAQKEALEQTSSKIISDCEIEKQEAEPITATDELPAENVALDEDNAESPPTEKED